MRNRNKYTPYNHYSKRQPVEEPVSSEAIAEEIKEEPVIEPIVEEKKEETKVVEKVLNGKIVNCDMVNVRIKPEINAPIASVILKGEPVLVSPDKSTDKYYSVVTKIGIDGFIVKDYVEIQ